MQGYDSKRRQIQNGDKSKTATIPKRRQSKTATDQNGDTPKRRQSKTATDQNGDTPKRRQTKTATLQNGDTSKTATHQNGDTSKTVTNQNGDTPKRRHTMSIYYALLTCRSFGFVAILVVSKTATNPKRRHVKTAKIQLDLYTKLIQNAVLTCIQNGDKFKTATLSTLIWIYKLAFISRTIPLIYNILALTEYFCTFT